MLRLRLESRNLSSGVRPPAACIYGDPSKRHMMKNKQSYTKCRLAGLSENQGYDVTNSALTLRIPAKRRHSSSYSFWLPKLADMRPSRKCCWSYFEKACSISKNALAAHVCISLAARQERPVPNLIRVGGRENKYSYGREMCSCPCVLPCVNTIQVLGAPRHFSVGLFLSIFAYIHMKETRSY